MIMGDTKRYEKYTVTYNETDFQIDGGDLKHSMHYNYSDINSINVSESNSGWAIKAAVGIAVAAAGIDKDTDRLFKKKYDVNLVLKNGEKIILVLKKNHADEFCFDIIDGIWSIRQRNSAFSGRWENARQGNDQRKALYRSKWENAGQGKDYRKGNSNFANGTFGTLKSESSKLEGAWFCPGCGRTNGQNVTICTCGRRQDGTNALSEGKTEPKSDNKAGGSAEIKKNVDTTKKWRCTKCQAINDGRMMKCTCGALRFEPEPGPVQAASANMSAAANRFLEDGAVKLKHAYSSQTVRIKIDQVMIKDLKNGKCGLAFSGEQKYGKPVDAILCNVKLQDPFGEILSQDKISFLIADNSGDSYVTAYEEITIDEHLHKRVRKADIEVLKIAFE